MGSSAPAQPCPESTNASSDSGFLSGSPCRASVLDGLCFQSLLALPSWAKTPPRGPGWDRSCQSCCPNHHKELQNSKGLR